MADAEQAGIGNLPTHEAIEVQLARILNSEILSTSDRSKAFVAFVVRQTLLGKGAELKELVTRLRPPAPIRRRSADSCRRTRHRLRLHTS